MIYGLTKPPLGAKINWSHNLAKGIVGCWLFNEGMGDKVYDSSGNGNTGTLTNYPFPPTTARGWNPGFFGKTIRSDGAGSTKIVMQNIVTPIYAISFWFNFYSLTGTPSVIHCGGDTDDDNQWDWGMQLYGSWFVLICRTPKTTIFGLPVVANKNTHIVILRDNGGTESSVWFNGIKVGQSANRGTACTTPIKINVTSAMKGLIDNLQIWNRPLLPKEIIQLYTEPFCMFND
jgi:hypothetical protein